MRLKKRSYPSKLLLFGEYGVLLGLDALAAAFPEYSGRLELTGQTPDENLIGLSKHLKKISGYFPYKILQDEFDTHISKGLRFVSDIPLNYGLGSSGALVAAIFENYIDKKSLNTISDLRALKTSLALFESHFHGISSGIDPLVSIMKKPVLVRRSGKVYLLDKPVIRKRKKLHFFLLDSGQAAKTGDLVTGFMDKMNDSEFSNTFSAGYKKYSNGAIRHLVNKRHVEFYQKFSELSSFQIDHMNELIPEHIQGFFTQGLDSGEYALKICGSGGGGYFLGVTQKKSILDQFDKDNLVVL